MKDDGPRTQGPEPSTVRLAPRGFSVRVVDSLGGGFLHLVSLGLFIHFLQKILLLLNTEKMDD